ncbi:response regulator transcription factor [bacterium]|nr:response regulator transcription factor [bacterium]
MVVNFTSENFRIVIVDDNDILDDNSSFEFAENCCFEIRVRKSFLYRILAEANSELADSIVSNIVMTSREIQVLKYLAAGLNNHQISKKMNVSVHTIKAHIHNIFDKLSVQGRTQAVVKALKDNLIDL